MGIKRILTPMEVEMRQAIRHCMEYHPNNRKQTSTYNDMWNEHVENGFVGFEALFD